MLVDPITPSTRITLFRDETRVFPFIADIMTFQAIMLRLWGFHHEEPEAFGPASNSIFACIVGKMDLRVPLGGFADAALAGQLPDTIEIETAERMDEPDTAPMHGVTGISTRLMSSAFAVFTDGVVEWVEHNVTTDRHKFPPNINFGRVARNAVVHGDRINIRSPNAPVVCWRGLSISHQDYGTKLLNPPLLSGGDLILLMLEMEMELNALNAPFDLG